MVNQVLKDEVIQLEADFCAALSDPNRIFILYALNERPLNVTELTNELGVPQPTISRHLKVLRETGFATVRAEGPRRVYEVAATPLGEVDAWLDRFRSLWASRLDALATEVARGKRERRTLQGG